MVMTIESAMLMTVLCRAVLVVTAAVSLAVAVVVVVRKLLERFLLLCHCRLFYSLAGDKRQFQDEYGSSKVVKFLAAFRSKIFERRKTLYDY
jgi:uncharacterized membrane protein YjjB (DUF3815 family)